MRKQIHFIFILLSISLVNLSKAQTNVNQAFEIFANDHFIINNDNGNYFINTNKDKWETICLKLNNSYKFKNEEITFQIGNSENINLSIISHSKIDNSEVTVYENYLQAGLSYLKLNLSNFDLDFNKEILLYIYIQKGEKWKGGFSIKLANNNIQPTMNKLNIYPNPCRDEFTVSCEEKNGKISLINSSGAIVNNVDYDKNTKIKHNLPSGNYTIVYTTENKKHTGNINIIK